MRYLSSVHKIQAAVLRAGGGPLKIESLEIEGPQDDEVLVRIVSSGICRTDIDFMDDFEGDPVVWLRLWPPASWAQIPLSKSTRTPGVSSLLWS